jgi:hypothetical protein
VTREPAREAGVGCEKFGQTFFAQWAQSSEITRRMEPAEVVVGSERFSFADVRCCVR